MKALILDFDGLILETESMPSSQWRVVYENHGVCFPATNG